MDIAFAVGIVVAMYVLSFGAIYGGRRLLLRGRQPPPATEVPGGWPLWIVVAGLPGFLMLVVLVLILMRGFR